MASIKLDQATPGPGVADTARADLITGEQVDLVIVSGSGTTYAWTLEDQPPGSTATITNPSQASGAFFTPDKFGAYKVQLVIDAGAPDQIIGTVRSPRWNIREPAFGEELEFDGIDGKGWDDPFWYVINQLEILAPQSMQREVIVTDGTPETIPRELVGIVGRDGNLDRLAIGIRSGKELTAGTVTANLYKNAEVSAFASVVLDVTNPDANLLTNPVAVTAQDRIEMDVVVAGAIALTGGGTAAVLVDPVFI